MAELIPLTVPEVRRLMLAVLDATAQRDFRLGWSRWRRIHQAVAARCHTARRALKHDAVPSVRSASPSANTIALTNAEWDCVQPLLPPQRGRPGRPSHDHRAVLTGILSVVRSGGSWREVPAACGKWETAYKCYRLWQDSGLWAQILTALDAESR